MRFIFIFLFISIASVQSFAEIEQPISNSQKIFGLSSIWMEAKYNFAYFDQVPDLDWDAEYQRYINKALLTKNNYEYYTLLKKFTALLKDGMTTVSYPPGMLNQYIGFPAVKIDNVQKKALVVNIDKKLEHIIPIGSIILDVDNKPIDEKLQDDVFPLVNSSTESGLWHQAIAGNKSGGYGLLAGSPGTRVKLRLQLPNGTIKAVDLKREPSEKNVDWLASTNRSYEKSFSYKKEKNNISYILLNDFDDISIVDEFKKHIKTINKSNGLIIDLRNNRGGNTYVAEEIIKHLSFYNVLGPRTKMRVHNSAFKAWGKFSQQYDWAKKYSSYFNGNAWMETEPYKLDVAGAEKTIMPTVILIGRNTSGAAEDFLVYADTLKHIKKLGSPTWGSTGQPLIFDLPGGGEARICAKRDMYSDGRDFVGYGIQPDILAKTNVNDVIKKKDTVLEKAIEYFDKK